MPLGGCETPSLPQVESAREMADYRRGRHAVLAELARLIGGLVAAFETAGGGQACTDGGASTTGRMRGEAWGVLVMLWLIGAAVALVATFVAGRLAVSLLDGWRSPARLWLAHALGWLAPAAALWIGLTFALECPEVIWSLPDGSHGVVSASLPASEHRKAAAAVRQEWDKATEYVTPFGPWAPPNNLSPDERRRAIDETRRAFAKDSFAENNALVRRLVHKATWLWTEAVETPAEFEIIEARARAAEIVAGALLALTALPQALWLAIDLGRLRRGR